MPMCDYSNMQMATQLILVKNSTKQPNTFVSPHRKQNTDQLQH